MKASELSFSTGMHENNLSWKTQFVSALRHLVSLQGEAAKLISMNIWSIRERPRRKAEKSALRVFRRHLRDSFRCPRAAWKLKKNALPVLPR